MARGPAHRSPRSPPASVPTPPTVDANCCCTAIRSTSCRRAAQERLTLIPLKLYLRDGKVKSARLGKGRQKADKRQTIARRDSRRDRRELGRRRKGTG